MNDISLGTKSFVIYCCLLYGGSLLLVMVQILSINYGGDKTMEFTPEERRWA